MNRLDDQAAREAPDQTTDKTEKSQKQMKYDKARNKVSKLLCRPKTYPEVVSRECTVLN